MMETCSQYDARSVVYFGFIWRLLHKELVRLLPKSITGLRRHKFFFPLLAEEIRSLTHFLAYKQTIVYLCVHLHSSSCRRRHAHALLRLLLPTFTVQHFCRFKNVPIMLLIFNEFIKLFRLEPATFLNQHADVSIICICAFCILSHLYASALSVYEF